MSAAILLLIGLVLMSLGYLIYSRFIAQRIYRLDPDFRTPAHEFEDGIDFVPTNRFEYIECIAAIREIENGNLDGIDPKDGGLDVLAQHIFATACSAPFHAPTLYKEIIRAWPYRNLTEKDFYDSIALVMNGGYALKSYDQFSRLIEDEDKDDVYKLRNKKDTRRYRMNVGTIIEAPILKVMLKNRTLGTIEEAFVNNLSLGDTFLFGGQVLEYQGLHNSTVKVKRTKSKQAQIPSYAGGRMPLSTHLSHAVRYMIGRPKLWADFPDQVKDWLKLHKTRSAMPNEKHLLVETFPRDKKHYMVAYTFAGRNANQTLGLLAMKRMKRIKRDGLRPMRH